MFKYLIFCLLLLSGASASGCVDKTEAEGPCNIKLHVCPDTYDWQVVYKTTATDLKSGIQADNSAGQHFHSSTGSGEGPIVRSLTLTLHDIFIQIYIYKKINISSKFILT